MRIECKVFRCAAMQVHIFIARLNPFGRVDIYYGIIFEPDLKEPRVFCKDRQVWLVHALMVRARHCATATSYAA